VEGSFWYDLSIAADPRRGIAENQPARSIYGCTHILLLAVLALSPPYSAPLAVVDFIYSFMQNVFAGQGPVGVLAGSSVWPTKGWEFGCSQPFDDHDEE
jgi:hypothetical protein